jgi:hypothetical protein
MQVLRVLHDLDAAKVLRQLPCNQMRLQACCTVIHGLHANEHSSALHSASLPTLEWQHLPAQTA